MTLQSTNPEELETIIQKIDPNMVKRLNEVWDALLKDVERKANHLPSSKNTEKIIDEIHALKQSKEKGLWWIFLRLLGYSPD